MGIRPSDYVGIVDNFVRFEFDHAVTALGAYVDNKSQEFDKDGKPKYTVRQILGLAPKTTTNLRRSQAERSLIIKRKKKKGGQP